MIEKTGVILLKVEALYAAGHCDEAVALLSDSLSAEPARTDILIKLAEFLIDSERYENALDFLKRFDSAGNHPLATLQRALCLEATGDRLSAEKLADHLIGTGQHCAEALALKARLAESAGQKDAAETLFTKAIECDPACGRAWFGLASVKLENQEEPRTFDLLRQAFQCSPDSRVITTAFHRSSIDSDNFQEAEAALHEALAVRPMNRRLRFLLIDLQLRQGRVAEAMTGIEAALVDFGTDEGLLSTALKIRRQIGPLSIAARSEGGGTVSLCMIVKNEKNHLARCLKSAKPVVDEIIAVDTGSIDSTKDIAEVFGAQVFDFVWADDFSKARNFSLSKATGDWILVLDADEVLSAQDQDKFKQILATARSRPAAFRIQTRNYSSLLNTIGFRPNRGEFPEERGIGWYPSEKVRLFTNDPRIRFEYPVHELLEPSLEKLQVAIQDCSVGVHHFGTLENTRTLEKTKTYRNLEKRKVKKKSRNAAALKELAVQSAQLGSHSEALDLWRQFIRLQPNSAEAYLNMGSVCWNLGRYTEAVSYAEKASRLNPGLKEARFNHALALLCMGNVEEAKSFLERLLTAERNYQAAQFLLCVACACKGELKRFENELAKLQATSLGPYLGESFLDIARKLITASQIEIARRTLEAAVAADYTNSEIMNLLSNCHTVA